MSDESQIVVPRSFVELFLRPGSVKPTASREQIASRYELCEDLAQMFIDTARMKLFELGVAEGDVLERILQGLVEDDSVVTAREARWVVRRLAELLEWPPLPDGG